MQQDKTPGWSRSGKLSAWSSLLPLRPTCRKTPRRRWGQDPSASLFTKQTGTVQSTPCPGILGHLTLCFSPGALFGMDTIDTCEFPSTYKLMKLKATSLANKTFSGQLGQDARHACPSEEGQPVSPKHRGVRGLGVWWAMQPSVHPPLPSKRPALPAGPADTR